MTMLSLILNKFRVRVKEELVSPSIVIKTPVTKWKRAKSWGDYHLAFLLKKELERKGHRVLIQILPEWDNEEGSKYDVVLVFRGLSRYTVKSNQINIMWNISHPDDVALGEYEDYNYVFIASSYWAEKISKKVSIPIASMLQCTSPERFFLPSSRELKKYRRQLLFIGNSRDIYRKVIKDLLPTNYQLAVFGKNWDGLIAKKYINGTYIKNNHLYKYYGSADVLLNDHWDDMREKGFVSNRIFDGLSCGAFIVSDRVYAMGDIERFVQVYDSKEELANLLEYYLENPEKREVKALKGMAYVRQYHTFKNRADQISSVINKLVNE